LRLERGSVLGDSGARKLLQVGTWHEDGDLFAGALDCPESAIAVYTIA